MHNATIRFFCYDSIVVGCIEFKVMFDNQAMIVERHILRLFYAFVILRCETIFYA